MQIYCIVKKSDWLNLNRLVSLFHDYPKRLFSAATPTSNEHPHTILAFTFTNWYMSIHTYHLIRGSTLTIWHTHQSLLLGTNIHLYYLARASTLTTRHTHPPLLSMSIHTRYSHFTLTTWPSHPPLGTNPYYLA